MLHAQLEATPTSDGVFVVCPEQLAAAPEVRLGVVAKIARALRTQPNSELLEPVAIEQAPAGSAQIIDGVCRVRPLTPNIDMPATIPPTPCRPGEGVGLFIDPNSI